MGSRPAQQDIADPENLFDLRLEFSGRTGHGSGVDLFSQRQAPAPQALSVTQLLRRVKNLLESAVGEVWVEGEVSNLKKQGIHIFILVM